jgi:hypothetical protein
MSEVGQIGRADLNYLAKEGLKRNKCSLTPASKEHSPQAVSQITSCGTPSHLNFRNFEVGLLKGAIATN